MEEKELSEEEIIDNVKLFIFNIITNKYSCILISLQKISKTVKLFQ
jgi:hypothetical protein